MDDTLLQGLQSTADWLNTVLLSGLGIAGTALFLRLVRKDEIEVFGVQLHRRMVWIPLMALTLAHGVLALLHLKGASNMMFAPSGVEKNDPVRQQAWVALTERGPLVFRHVVPRAQIGWFSLPDLRHPARDPLAIPSYLAAMAFAMAHVRWRGVSRWTRVRWIVVGTTVLLLNWTIASAWILGTQELRGSRTASLILSQLKDSPTEAR